MDGRDEWRRLLAEDPDVEYTAGVLEVLTEGADGALPSGLAGAADAVFDSLLLAPPELERDQLIDALAALADRAVGVDTSASSVGTRGIAKATTLLHACGRPADPVTELRSRIDAVLGGDLTAKDVTTFALVCSALGLDDAVDELVGRDDTFVADRGEGPDAQAYARAVVAAARSDAAAGDLATAFTSFAIYYPARQSAGGLDTCDLLFAGYGIFGRLGGSPGTVLDDVRAFVRDMADS
jgi:hypothetical protein